MSNENNETELSTAEKKKAVNLQDLIYIKKYIQDGLNAKVDKHGLYIVGNLTPAVLSNLEVGTHYWETYNQVCTGFTKNLPNGCYDIIKSSKGSTNHNGYYDFTAFASELNGSLYVCKFYYTNGDHVCVGWTKFSDENNSWLFKGEWLTGASDSANLGIPNPVSGATYQISFKNALYQQTECIFTYWPEEYDAGDEYLVYLSSYDTNKYFIKRVTSTSTPHLCVVRVDPSMSTSGEYISFKYRRIG